MTTKAVIGYARTSTLDQTAGLDAQLRDLHAAGCTKIFSEKVSSVDHAKRQELERALDYAREGDVVVVAKLDRLARSMSDLVHITERLDVKGVGLRVLNLSLDTTTATGKLMLNMIASIAQFEREIMLERQREGIAKAKTEGKYKGRTPTARNQAGDVRRLKAAGKTSDQIVIELGISRSSVFRILRANKQDVAGGD